MRTKLLLTAAIFFAALVGTAKAQSYDHFGGRNPYADRDFRDRDRDRFDHDRFDRDDRGYYRDRDDRWGHERREHERWERRERRERLEEMREARWRRWHW